MTLALFESIQAHKGELMKIIERIVNLETNETVDVERDMTADELAMKQDSQQKGAAKAAESAAKLAEKAALLEKLGITEAEAKLLLS